jgi:hypothetical protein
MARAIGPVTVAHNPAPTHAAVQSRGATAFGSLGCQPQDRSPTTPFAPPQRGRPMIRRAEVGGPLAEMARAIGPATAAHNPGPTHVSVLSRGATAFGSLGCKPQDTPPRTPFCPASLKQAARR